MNARIDQSNTDILKGKRILFVEDHPQTLDFFIEELEEVVDGIKITQAPTLSEAVSKLSAQDNKFALVVIDLHMPGDFPQELRVFAERIAPDLNQGQTLGLWLDETHKSIPYIYLSSVPDAYNRNGGDKPAEKEPINKFRESIVDFPGHLAGALQGG